MKVKVKEYTEKEIEVNPPIYRKIETEYSTVYIYWCPSFITYFIQEDLDGTTYEFEIREETNFSPNESADYVLGKGEYASSKEEWEEALAKATRFIGRFPWIK